MKNKPALWAVIGLPIAFLLLLAGSVRGLSYLSDPNGSRNTAQNAPPEDNAPSPPMQPADAKTAAEIKKVAGGQVAALQKRNYKEALKFAQPEFQTQWTPETFGKMIEGGYKELVTAKTVRFDAPKIASGGESAIVFVVAKDAQNTETRFLYILSRDTPPTTKGSKAPAGGSAWHVSGCSRIPNAPLPPPVRSLHEA